MEQQIQLMRGNGQLVEGLLCRISLRHINDFNEVWKPMLEALGEEDKFWSWSWKKGLVEREDRYEGYAVEYDGLTQGLMWLETQWHRSQWVRGERLVYVEALASAPWNRRMINPDPWLRGIGTILLGFARKRSLDLGYGGRLGLHALEGSESYYESRNMLNLGYDEDRELVYFEYGVLGGSRMREEGNDD